MVENNSNMSELDIIRTYLFEKCIALSGCSLKLECWFSMTSSHCHVVATIFRVHTFVVLQIA